MQLIIEIPEDVYREIMDGSDIEIYYGETIVVKDSWASNIMRNGTPLPEHHGDLKDVSILKKSLTQVADYTDAKAIWEDDVDEAPTIIPATKGDNKNATCD